MLKSFLKEKHPDVYNAFKIEWSEYLKTELKKIGEDNIFDDK